VLAFFLLTLFLFASLFSYFTIGMGVLVDYFTFPALSDNYYFSFG